MPKKKKIIRKGIRINGKVVERIFSNRQDANDWYQKMLQQKRRARAGLEVEFEPVEIEHIAADFIRSRMRNETWKHDKFRIEYYFLPKFIGRMIHLITRKEWKDALDELISVHGLKPKTYNNIRTVLSCLYDYAIKEEPKRAQFNPIKEIKPLPVMQEEIQFFHTAAECQKYLIHAQARSPVFGMFAYIAINSGMREGEITSLRYDCVDLENRTILVKRIWSYSQRKIVERTKGKRERILGINDSLFNAFIRYRANSPFNKSTDLVIYKKKGGALESKHLQEMHADVIRQAGLKYIVIHGLRHTFATQYLAKGGSIWDLKNILGHESIKTTERYAHFVPLKLQERSNVFEVSSINE